MNFKPPFYTAPSTYLGEHIFEEEFKFDENGVELIQPSLSCDLDLPPRSQYTLEVLMQQGVPLDSVPLTPIVSQPLKLD